MHPTPQPIDRFWATDASLKVLLGLQVLFIFFLHPLDALGYHIETVGSLVLTLMLLSGIAAVARTPVQAVVFAIVAVTAVTIHWARYAIFGSSWMGADAGASFVACGMLATIVLLQVFRAGPITSSRIEGAIAAYLLIALMFASVYAVIDALSGAGAFNGVTLTGDGNPVRQFVYFSFVTLTTVGYGDIVPVAPFARSMAIMEAVIGQIFPAILLARLVSMELYSRQMQADSSQR